MPKTYVEGSATKRKRNEDEDKDEQDEEDSDDSDNEIVSMSINDLHLFRSTLQTTLNQDQFNTIFEKVEIGIPIKHIQVMDNIYQDYCRAFHPRTENLHKTREMWKLVVEKLEYSKSAIAHVNRNKARQESKKKIARNAAARKKRNQNPR